MQSVDAAARHFARHPGDIGSPKVKAWLTCSIKMAGCDWAVCHMLRHDPRAQARPDGLHQPSRPVEAAATVDIGSANRFVAFEDREPARRMMSLRRANRREANHDVKAIKEGQPEDADARGRSVDYSGSGIRS